MSIRTSDGSAQSINAQHALAVDGDTITMPNGSFPWTTTVTLSKAVTLQALNMPVNTSAGITACSRTYNSSNFHSSPVTVSFGSGIGSGASLVTINTSTAGHITLAGINFTLGTASGNTQHYLTVNNDNQIAIVHDCSFALTQSALFNAISWQASGGLVYFCHIFANTNSTFSGGPGVDSGVFVHKSNIPWLNSSTFGTLDATGTKNLYIEDCVFDLCVSQGLDMDDNSRAVVRHCSLNNSQMLTHGTTSLEGGRHVEMYNNIYAYFGVSGFSGATTTFPNMTRWWWQRAGTGYFHDNTIDHVAEASGGFWTAQNSFHFTDTSLTRSGSGSGCQTEADYPGVHWSGTGANGTSQIVDPVRIWNNVAGPTDGASSGRLWSPENDPGGCPGGFSTSNVFLINRDIFLSAPSGYTPFTYPHPLASTSPPDTTPPSAPSTPTLVAVSSTQINVTMTTAATDNVDGPTALTYHVERRIGAAAFSGVDYATFPGTVSPLNYSDLACIANTSYGYRVRASDTSGNLGGYATSAANVTTPALDTTPPTVPTGLAAGTATTNSIPLTWTQSTDPPNAQNTISYTINRKIGTGAFAFRVTTAPGASSFNDTGLTALTQYTYQIEAVDGSANHSGFSGTQATATTLAATGTTYYISNTIAGNSDANNGLAPATPWKNCPGMAAYTGSGTLNPGDTVFFNNTDTWILSSGTQGLFLTGGVTYIGDSFSVGGIVAPTFVQGNFTVPTGPISSVARSYPNAQISGNCNLVWLFTSNSFSVNVPTDTQGNVYTLLQGPILNSSAAWNGYLFISNNIASHAAGNLVTVTFSGSSPWCEMMIAEYTSVSDVSPLDSSSSANGATTTAASSITPTVATDTILSAMLNIFPTNPVTTPTNYTLRVTTFTDLGSGSGTANMAERRNAPTGSNSPAWTWASNPSNNWTEMNVALKGVAGGSVGSRAILRANSAGFGAGAGAGVVRFRDHTTIETVFQGFEVDANNFICNGIDVNHSFFSVMNGAMKRIINCDVHNTNSSTSGGTFQYGVIISNHGGTGGYCDNVIVDSCKVHDTSRDALCMYTGDENIDCRIQNITFRNCECYNSGQDPTYGAGAGVLCKGYVVNGVVENCYVHNTKGAGIFVDSNSGTNWGSPFAINNLHVRYNIITDPSGVNANGGIRIYDGNAAGTTIKDVKVYGNIVYNWVTNGGFYIDNDLHSSSTAIRVYNNTFFNSPVLIRNTLATFQFLEFRNNIIFYNGGVPFTDTTPDVTLHSNNTFFSTGSTRVNSGGTLFTSANLTTYEVTSRSVDPVFSNQALLPAGFSGTFGVDLAPITNGLSLQSSSTSDNSGAVLAAPYNGSINSVTRSASIPDRGAYESLSASSATPTPTVLDSTVSLVRTKRVARVMIIYDLTAPPGPAFTTPAGVSGSNSSVRIRVRIRPAAQSHLTASYSVRTSGTARITTADAQSHLTAAYVVRTTGGSGQSYSTTFLSPSENPISEGGRWINGKAQGVNWCDVQKTPGKCFGTQDGTHGTSANADDSTAVLTGVWRPNQTAVGTIFLNGQSNASGIFEEVELRLRTTITADNISGYEINVSANQTGGNGTQPYMQIGRWNGPHTYVLIDSRSVPVFSSGATLTATVTGGSSNTCTITATLKNAAGTVLFSYSGVDGPSPSAFTGGSPGVGFFMQNGPISLNPTYGFIDFNCFDSP